MPSNHNHYHVDISMRSIWRIIVVLLVLFFLFTIKEIIAIIFVAWVLASALNPLVNKLQQYKIPRFVSILAIYLILLFLLALIFFLLVPPVIEQVTLLAKDFPKYSQPIVDGINNLKKTSEEYGFLDNLQQALEGFGNSINTITGDLYNAATGFVTGIITVVTILVITFYMTIEEEGIKKFLQTVLPYNIQPYILQKITKIQSKLGSWLWGQIFLMIIIGVCSAIALKLIGVPYILVLAIFAGFCEFIPYLGPIISTVPAFLFTLPLMYDSPWKPVLVIIAYVIIQQLENNILVPKIMNKAVGLNPIIVIITMLIGAKLGGVIGIVLAVPIATIISIFLEDFFASQEAEANKLEGKEYIEKL